MTWVDIREKNPVPRPHHPIPSLKSVIPTRLPASDTVRDAAPHLCGPLRCRDGEGGGVEVGALDLHRDVRHQEPVGSKQWNK